MHNPKISRLLARNDGVITRNQALHVGLSSDAVDRKVRSGEWLREQPGMYRAADRPSTPRSRLRASVWACGPGAVACGPSAAWWHGLIDRAPAKTWISVPLSERGGSHVRAVRRNLSAMDVMVRDNLGVTAPQLSVLETSAVLVDGAQIMDRALQQGRVHIAGLELTLERNRGRKWMATAGALVRIAKTGGESEAERRFLRMLRRSNIRGWTAHYPLLGGFIDVAFPDVKLAIEIDGWAWHRDVERFNRDMARQNRLVNAGWRVLRFSWHQIVGNPQQVLADVRAALAAS